MFYFWFKFLKYKKKLRQVNNDDKNVDFVDLVAFL
jgi:hypothetical protein